MSKASRPRSKGKTNRTRTSERITLTPLTTEEVRKLPKPHVGFEAFVEVLAKLVEAYPNDFGTGIDVAAMRESLANYQALQPERDETASLLALLDDTRVQLSSSVWMQELLIYDRARSAARTNPAVLHAIEAFEQFMKRGPQKKAPATTPPAPTA